MGSLREKGSLLVTCRRCESPTITYDDDIFCVVCGRKKSTGQVHIEDVYGLLKNIHEKKRLTEDDLDTLLWTVEYLMYHHETFAALLTACFKNSVVLNKQIDFFKNHFIKEHKKDV